jgi:hypothetical protein
LDEANQKVALVLQKAQIDTNPLEAVHESQADGPTRSTETCDACAAALATRRSQAAPVDAVR